MITLSLCMIVKNEEDVLARCLACMKDIADEIIIVDTGSVDRTKEIASDFTSHIYDFPWCDDFAKARNYSFSKATMEYTMWLDADDIINEENQGLLLNLKKTILPSVDMIMMKYDVAFDEQNNPTLSYYRERIFKTAGNYKWIGEIHEVIPQAGNVIYKEISICHQKMHPNEQGRNLKIFEKIIADGKTMDPRQQYYYARELYFNGRYEEAAEILTCFINQKKGWVENSISACKDLALCYYAMNKPEAALENLLKSMTFDRPRAEICCDIGKHFLDREFYGISAFWYEVAAGCQINQQNGGFCLPDCYNYIPYIQLCVCYDRLGEQKKAMEYNEMAGKIKPTDKSYLYNKSYFEKLTSHN